MRISCVFGWGDGKAGGGDEWHSLFAVCERCHISLTEAMGSHLWCKAQGINSKCSSSAGVSFDPL